MDYSILIDISFEILIKCFHLQNFSTKKKSPVKKTKLIMKFNCGGKRKKNRKNSEKNINKQTKQTKHTHTQKNYLLFF